MDYKLKRQLLFGGGFLIVVVLVSASIYQALKPTLTCTDGILNQQEEKVDCGGPFCTACKETKLEEIQVLSYRSFLSADLYDAFAQVRNVNSGHGSRSFSYIFRFFDSSNQQIAERTGRTYILAGQTRYIVESNIELQTRPSSVTFAIDGRVAWEPQEQLTGQITLPVFSKTFENTSPSGSNYAKMSGVVENQTESSLALVDVQVVLVDANQEPIAVGKTQIDSLRFSESRSFMVLFPPDIQVPADMYAEATTNIFDRSNVQ